MSVYIPNTRTDREKMLARIGVGTLDALYRDIPAEIRLTDALNLGAPLSEAELGREIASLAEKNADAARAVCFLGAGAYDRLIPSAIKHMVSRSEFYTAYTPYQPEISQGTLQAIFEFQTMISSLTGMDAANASMYDGASACAEAVLMAVRHTKRRRVLVAETVHPETREVIRTYARFNGIEIAEIPEEGGLIDSRSLSALLSEDTAGLVVQTPNFFGLIEDLSEIEPLTHERGALLIASVADPLSLAILESPGRQGADIAVGEGQSFGMGLQFGGPYLGFMAVKAPLIRKLPGRIVGQTSDIEGKRAFVLTLQAREQHIRREKATSNICSNQGLNALIATIYLTLLGKNGLREAATHSFEKAHYLKHKLVEAGMRPLFDAPFFDEFAVELTADAREVNGRLMRNGVLGGYPLADVLPEAKYPGRARAMLLCVTEKRTKEEMDRLAVLLSEACVEAASSERRER
ncbi:MAG: aminomethyl-transferring glycine dehydrogenase subunit GcvPA [Clostridiales Family XIII bacterium]|jgi:glycine dehydrogenase subunit 1|nr:aminomethyl-transferring glycine dehydrogenase subunit GcvPA [Clostridiales Family XIII bacterium]